jgi:hypothetical protein
MSSVVPFKKKPETVFDRWVARFPHEAAIDRDPRGPMPCEGNSCQTFAWKGYEPFCGWCFEELELGR